MKSIQQLWEQLKDVEVIQVHPEEMEPMYKHCFEFKEPNIVEIGSAHGASSIIFGEAAQELDGHVFCIDSYPEDYYAQKKFGRYAQEQFDKNVISKYYKHVTQYRMPSAEAIKEPFFQDLTIDILFVDGDHSYDGVRKDCEFYLPKLVKGGYVGFHDYNNVAYWGVKKASDEFTWDWKYEDAWNLRIFKKP